MTDIACVKFLSLRELFFLNQRRYTLKETSRVPVAHRHTHVAFLKEKQESTISLQAIGNCPKQSWRVTESRSEIQLGTSSRQLWFVRVKHDKKQQYYTLM
jgi:hypothetical protein